MTIHSRGPFYMLFVFASLLFQGCAPSYQRYLPLYELQKPAATPDYSDLRCWAAHPLKKDPSDSIPSPLLAEPRDTLADVFFIHPTSYTQNKIAHANNAPLDNARMNAKTDYKSILYQGSIFNQHARVYAPRYRQAYLGMYYTKDTAAARAAFELAYEDIRQAFLYYLEHENQGRPIIIVGHSQGTTHGKRLLKEFFDGTPLQKQLVVAYLAGIPIPKNYYRAIPICQDTAATGCIASWRTYRKGYTEPRFVKKESEEAIVVNPLNWKADTSYAPASLNAGSILFNFNKLIIHTNDAQVHGNVLWISKPRFPWSFLYTKKNYHPGDFNLFYRNLQKDLYRRISCFIKNNK